MRSASRSFLVLALLASSAVALPTSAAADDSRVVARRDGKPWLWLGARSLTTSAGPGDTVSRARAAIVSTMAGAAPSIAKLALAATSTDRFGDGDTIVRFGQTHLGLPVIGRGAAARIDAHGVSTMLAVDVEEDLPSSATPAISAHDAARTAARFSIRVGAGASADDAHLVVWPLRGGGSRLAWAVLPVVPTGIPSAPRIIVDALDGKVLDARDMVRFAKANVYQFNPIKTPNLLEDTLALTPAGGKLTNDFVTASNCIDNKTVRSVDFSGFKTSVHVCDLVQTAVADGNGDFLYQPTDVAGSEEAKTDSFSEVQMYYHASKAYAFFRGLQGVADAKVVEDKPLPVVANLQIPAGISSGNLALAADPNTPLQTFSNAFFSPAVGGLGDIFGQLYGLKTGALWFGQGPQRDYAYDGDVVYHEFTHAVVDVTLKLEQWHVDEHGVVDSPGAMNEGLADYFSSAITGDPDVGEYASKDLGSGGDVIRTLANTDRCPTNIIGEVHSDSTLFSGGLWTARTSLPEADRPKFDAALYKAMRANPGRGDLGYEDLANLFKATLATDLPSGAAALDKAMTDRGVLPGCTRIVEAKDTGVKAADPILGGFTAPGTQTVQLTADVIPGILQVHVPFGGQKPGKLEIAFIARKSRSGGGGGGLLGGGGAPFTPVVLTKFGKPITWTLSAGNQGKHDADLATPTDSLTGNVSVTVDVPEGATEAYVQIANKGDEDGTYDEITATLLPAAAPPTGNDPPADAPAPAPASDSGCSCTSAGHGTSPTSAAGLAFGAALALAAMRRRRT